MDCAHFTDRVFIFFWTYNAFLSPITVFGTGHLSTVPAVSSFSGNFSMQPF